MDEALIHRGGAGEWLERPGAALGVRGGRVGRSQDGSVLSVLDGAIFNRSSLAANCTSGRSDADLIANLYARHGHEFLARVRGDFALAVWDEDDQRGLLARDRQGVKPLYYRVGPDGALLFGSELKSLLATGLVPAVLDYEAIETFLSFGFVAGPRTAIQQVEKLHLGEALLFSTASVAVRPYWRYPEPREPAVRLALDEYAGAVLEQVDEAVKLRLESDREVGAMLSGGLDSAFVVGLMARHVAQVKTFTVAFRESPTTNELAAARQIAEAFGTDHHELELSFVDDTVSLEELAWRMDEPLAELSPLGLLPLASLAGKEVLAALSGQGADGIFGGLPHHRTAALVARLDWLPQDAKVLAARTFARRPGRLQRGTRVLAAQGAAARFLAQCNGLSERDRAALTREPLTSVGGQAAAHVVSKRLRGITGHPTATYIFLDEQLAAVDSVLHYNDRASTGGPIDIRFPFLDHRVVEFAATIPVDLKVRGFERKYLLRQVAQTVVPRDVLSRPKVGFFNAAIDAWIRAHTKTAVTDYLLGPSPRYADFLDRNEVERLVRTHLESDHSTVGPRLLGLLMLEVWLSHVIPRACAIGGSRDAEVVRHHGPD
jgi:asparagine synthase (glutamine-hydrolysing)